MVHTLELKSYKKNALPSSFIIFLMVRNTHIKYAIYHIHLIEINITRILVWHSERSFSIVMQYPQA